MRKIYGNGVLPETYTRHRVDLWLSFGEELHETSWRLQFVPSDPEVRGTLLWLPLSDIRVSGCESQSRLRFSDCNRLKCGPYGTNDGRSETKPVYSAHEPNVEVVINFMNPETANRFNHEFLNPNLFPTQLGLGVWATNESDLKLYNVQLLRPKSNVHFALSRIWRRDGTDETYKLLKVYFIDSNLLFDIRSTSSLAELQLMQFLEAEYVPIDQVYVARETHLDGNDSGAPDRIRLKRLTVSQGSIDIKLRNMDAGLFLRALMPEQEFRVPETEGSIREYRQKLVKGLFTGHNLEIRQLDSGKFRILTRKSEREAPMWVLYTIQCHSNPPKHATDHEKSLVILKEVDRHEGSLLFYSVSGIQVLDNSNQSWRSRETITVPKLKSPKAGQNWTIEYKFQSREPLENFLMDLRRAVKISQQSPSGSGHTESKRAGSNSPAAIVQNAESIYPDCIAGSISAPAPSEEDYLAVCFCPMGIEASAVKRMLDKELDGPQHLHHLHSLNAYSFGAIGEHRVVVAFMPNTGQTAAAGVAMQAQIDFPSVRFGFLIGVGGGIPDPDRTKDIHLGDVVVSEANDRFGGVWQFDSTGTLNKPPQTLCSYVEKLKSYPAVDGARLERLIAEAIDKSEIDEEEYRRPRPEDDRLFEASYTHDECQKHNELLRSSCQGGDRARLITRKDTKRTRPVIHYGLIGTSDKRITDSSQREQLRELEKDILCVEMEAAGVINNFSPSCLVIRGISDYADSHKNKTWQGYAALAAAAYMKELLSIIPPRREGHSLPNDRSKSETNNGIHAT